ncbi:hypothetical protein PINS_up001479 [Pythium insidiosum]|nr:hypothetical protein PINS_up001479 [Pythium insidiosum]
MYNTNVSCAVLLSFLKAACIKDIDDFCKQKSVQLAIELDAIRRTLVSRRSASSVLPPTSTPAASRPTSGAESSRPKADEELPEKSSTPTTPANTTRRSSKANLDDVAEEARGRKALFERQLDIVNSASTVIKGPCRDRALTFDVGVRVLTLRGAIELIAGISWLDLVDQNGTRMNIDRAGNDRANAILLARQQYDVVAVGTCART